MSNTSAPLTRLDSHYRDIFENATIAIWDEDFSNVKTAVEQLRADGVTDFRSYVLKHPELLERVVKQVNILDANPAMLRLHNATVKTEVLGTLDKFITPDDFYAEFIAFAEGETYFEREIVSQTLQGKPLDLLMTATYYMDSEGKPRALVHLTDITARKKAETDLRNQNEYLALLNEMTRTILLSDNYDATMHALASDLKKIISADDCYILRWDEVQQLPIPVATTAALDFPFTEAEVTQTELNLTAAILQAGRIIVVEDVSNSPNINLEITKRYPFHSIISMPLIAGNHRLGVAIIAFNSYHKFNQVEIERAEQAGNQVAFALLEFQQNQEIQRRLKESNTLTKIERALSETERVGTDKVLQLIVDSALDLIEHAEESVIHLVDSDNQALVPHAISGFDSNTKMREHPKMRLGEGVAGQVIRSSTSMIFTPMICFSSKTRRPRFDLFWLRQSAVVHNRSVRSASKVIS